MDQNNVFFSKRLLKIITLYRLAIDLKNKFLISRIFVEVFSQGPQITIPITNEISELVLYRYSLKCFRRLIFGTLDTQLTIFITLADPLPGKSSIMAL
jgi:hypothetical protein